MKRYSVLDVAKWFLSKESMTPKKIQKLSYYFEAWSNALFDCSLINDTVFEAWIHGPVSKKLYSEYKEYGWNDVPKSGSVDYLFDEKALDLLESVWVTYGDKSANELEILTHSELPWINARKGISPEQQSNNEISKEDMRKYYKSIYIGD